MPVGQPISLQKVGRPHAIPRLTRLVVETRDIVYPVTTMGTMSQEKCTFPYDITQGATVSVNPLLAEITSSMASLHLIPCPRLMNHSISSTYELLLKGCCIPYISRCKIVSVHSFSTNLKSHSWLSLSAYDTIDNWRVIFARHACTLGGIS